MTLTTTGTRHVFTSMGTAVSLVFAVEAPAGAIAAVENVFRALDDQFSLYKPESEATSVARGVVPIAQTSRRMRDTYDLAERWRSATSGAFTPHRPDGSIDLSGVVKAIAIDEAGSTLRAHGAADWCLNAGGDVLTSGTQADGMPWVVGVVDPTDRGRLLTQFTCSTAYPAVATSGVTERGEHVWRQDDADRLVQVTVVAGDIVTADVLATAILSGGRTVLDLALTRWPLEVIAASASADYYTTPAFRQ